MRTKNTFDLALALYKLGCKPTEEDVLKYISFYMNEDAFLLYEFNDIELGEKLGYINYCKKEETPIAVKNIYRLEHIVGILKNLCINEKRMSRL